MTQPSTPNEAVPPVNDAIKPPVVKLEDKMSRPPGSVPVMPGATLDSLKDLLEKNIRWSQVIYEQNKKILRRIFWSAIFTWVKIVVTIAIIIVAIFYASSWYRTLQKKYPFVFGTAPRQTATSTSSTSVDDFLKILPVSDSQREQLKQLIK